MTSRALRILHWHVHGSWTTSFVQGRHTYLLPTWTEPDVGGRVRRHGGRPAAWDWPASAVEVPVEELRGTDVDVVVLQRPQEIELVERHLGRRPGVDLPAVYLEHNAPRGDVPLTRHPVADRPDLLLVHVTHFNELFYDNGRSRTAVVEHGIPDPGHCYTGEVARAAVVVNEPVRRGRVTGTDLLPRFAAVAGLDVFGMGVHGLGEHLGLPPDRLCELGDLPQRSMHAELARRRVYLHTPRWTSLGLSLLEAMMLGMPVVAPACTEAVRAVPPGAGVLSTRVDDLVAAVAELVADPGRAAAMGAAARRCALRDHGLAQFLDRWDHLLSEVTS